MTRCNEHEKHSPQHVRAALAFWPVVVSILPLFTHVLFTLFTDRSCRLGFCDTGAQAWRLEGDCPSAPERMNAGDRVREQSSGDLSRQFVGGTAQQVEDGAKARDGEIWLFLSSDWEGKDLKLPDLKLGRGNEIKCHVRIHDGLLMCSCIVVLQGKQCGSLHLGLVAHCREYLWSITPPEMTRRFVEGSGMVDYLNIIWCIDSSFRLYRNVTSSVGVSEHTAANGSKWDAFWYIYRRGDNTPGYSHIGLDTSATLNNQKHVKAKLLEVIDLVPELRLAAAEAESSTTARKSRFSISSFFSKKSSSSEADSGSPGGQRQA